MFICTTTMGKLNLILRILMEKNFEICKITIKLAH